MSRAGVFSADLLKDLSLDAQGGVGAGGAHASNAKAGGANAHPAASSMSTSPAQQSGPVAEVDLLGDLVQPQVSSVAAVAGVCSPIDLLGDEVSTFAQIPSDGPQPQANFALEPSPGSSMCTGLDAVRRETEDRGGHRAEQPSGLPGGTADEISKIDAIVDPAVSDLPTIGKQEQASGEGPEGTTSPRAGNDGLQEQPAESESSTSAAAPIEEPSSLVLPQQQKQKHSVEELQQPQQQTMEQTVQHEQSEPLQQARVCNAAKAQEMPIATETLPGEHPSPCAADGSTESGVAALPGEHPSPHAEPSDGSAPERPSGDGGGGSQSLPSDGDSAGENDEPLSSNESEAQTGPGSDGDERPIDSDREVVEEEDAFGDFADFTSASHFLPGGGGVAAFGAPPPPPSASAAAAARAAAAAGGVSLITSSPSPHRHAHLGAIGRPMHGMLGSGAGAGGQHHGAGAASVSGAASEHGSLAGEFSDFSHHSPPPSVAPSRGGGGRKSVASIASVGSRAGGDDDLGDYGSVVGSSVWRAPSQMATSSYAAAAGADDDFGDFTSDITSTSDFAPSTQPPSAVAVSGPGSVHPDDDFGSFASHRSTADDDEDDFGNFNAAPAPAAAGAGAGGAAGAGPSGSGGTTAAATAGAAATSVAATSPAGLTGAAAGAGAGPSGAGAALSPRDATPAGAGSHPYHSTQSVGPVMTGGSGASATEATAVEAGLLQLTSAELRQAVVRALQPLLPAGTPALGPPQLPDDQVVSAAWAQLRRHMQGTLAEAGGDSGVMLQNGIPLPPLPGVQAGEVGGAPEGASMSKGGFTAAVKLTRPLRWKGSESERRLLSSLGLGELAAQARMLEAAEGPRPWGSRVRMDSGFTGGGVRKMGPLATFGDTPRRMRVDMGSNSAGLQRDIECDSGASGSNGAMGGGGMGGRSRGLDQSGEACGPLPAEQGVGPGSGATPRAAVGANGCAANGPQPQQTTGTRLEVASGLNKVK